jgi:glycosyltransferase involved in cell wall biosynthesis
MKIALVAAEYWPHIGGGAGVSATLLVRQLRKEGTSVDVYVFDKKHPSIFSDKGSTKYYDVIDYRFEPLVNLQVIKTLWKKLAQYDLIHAYSYGAGEIAALGFLRRTMLKVPVVATLNGAAPGCIYDERWMRFKCMNCRVSDVILCAFKRSKETEIFVPGPVLATYFTIQRLFSRSLDRYFALSDVIKKIYLAAGFPEDKIRVIPNMYDPEFLKKLEDVKVEKSDDKIIILYAGRLAREKGVEDLIEAFSKVYSQKAELWIVGRGPEERRLRDLANKVDEKKKIRFVGLIPYSDIPSVYKKADIFVHPGKWPEPFGRTILEAMLAKVPIITSDSGAPPMIVGDSGVIFKTGNIVELAKSLEMLIEDKKKRMDLALKAYNMAKNDYSPDTITKRIINEYEALTKRR